MKKKELDEQAVELQRRISNLQKDQKEIERQIFEKNVLPKMKKNIGLCFRSRNSYSCPKDENDYWWNYHKIVDITSDGYYRVESFQKCKPMYEHNSLFEFKKDTMPPEYVESGLKLTSIREELYDSEKNKLFSELKKW